MEYNGFIQVCSFLENIHDHKVSRAYVLPRWVGRRKERSLTLKWSGVELCGCLLMIPVIPVMSTRSTTTTAVHAYSPESSGIEKCDSTTQTAITSRALRVEKHQNQLLTEIM